MFAWALRLRSSAVEAVCGSPEREAGCLCDDRLVGRRPGADRWPRGNCGA